MFRHMDTYLEVLLDEAQYAFYQTVSDFAEKDIAPQVLTWERQHCLLPDDYYGHGAARAVWTHRPRPCRWARRQTARSGVNGTGSATTARVWRSRRERPPV